MSDLRRTAEVVWVIAMLLLGSGAFAPLWTDPTLHDQVIEGEASLQVVWALNYFVIAVILVSRWKEALALLSRNRFLCLLFPLCLASAAWSANPSVTLRKCAAFAGTTLLGLLLAMRFDQRQQLQLLVAALGIAAVASLTVSLVCPHLFPATELAPLAWNGVFSHKNVLGRNMALGALAFLLLARRGVATFVLSLCGAGLCFGLLLASHSQTALIVVLAIALLSYSSPLLRLEWRQSWGIVLLLVLACVPLAWLAVSHANTLTLLLHRDTTLTGRAKIWAYAGLSFAKRPWLGYGYGAFWWVADESRRILALIGYKTPHAHNGFLDLALQLGVVGVAVFLAGWSVAVVAAIRYLRLHPVKCAQWPLLYLCFIAVYSFTENSLLIPNSLLWVLYIAACTTIMRRPLPLSTAGNFRKRPSLPPTMLSAAAR